MAQAIEKYIYLSGTNWMIHFTLIAFLLYSRLVRFQQNETQESLNQIWLLNKHSFMKGSWRATADVNICFINNEFIKTHVIKTHWWYSLNRIAFVKWMHITYLIYHFLQPQAALFWDVSASFWFFLLIINREPDGVVFVSDAK